MKPMCLNSKFTTCQSVTRSGRAAAGLILAACISACGGNSGAQESDQTPLALSNGNPFTAVSSAPVSVRQKLLAHMEDKYLWYRDLPTVDLEQEKYSDLRHLLDDLRKKPEDKFSALVDATGQQQRIDEGVTGSYGLRFALRENADPLDAGLDLRIAGVDDYGSVGLAGIQRGDRIIAAQGQAIDELGYQGFRDIFTEPGLGVQRTIDIRHPDGREQRYTITRTEHDLNPVRKQSVFTHPQTGRRVGYLLVEEFIGLTSSQLQQFRAEYAGDGLDDLIVDLRYNTGGLVSASRDLASSIYGQSQGGDVYTTLRRNDKYTNENYSYYFRRFDNAFNTLARVFILTTASTCSASEEVINGLKPFMQVITIGSVTCGKPYASRSYNLIPDLINVNVLDSHSVNALGEGDFYQGFAPDCEAIDDPVRPYNDPLESLVSVALFYAENNRCPSAETNEFKSRATRGVTVVAPEADTLSQGAILTL